MRKIYINLFINSKIDKFSLNTELIRVKSTNILMQVQFFKSNSKKKLFFFNMFHANFYFSKIQINLSFSCFKFVGDFFITITLNDCESNSCIIYLI